MLERRRDCKAVAMAAGGGVRARETGLMSDCCSRKVGRAYRLSLTLGHHAAATPWGRGPLCSGLGERRGGCVCAVRVDGWGSVLHQSDICM